MRGLLLVVSLLLAAPGCADGAVDQSTACRQYVACVEALDVRRGVTTNVERYAPGGGCWGSEVGAALCNTSCERGLTFVAERFASAPSECAP